MRRGEIITGVFLILLSIAVWFNSAKFVSGARIIRTLSPAFYPRLLALCIVLCAVLLIVKASRAPEGGGAIPWGQWHKVLMGSIIMVFYAFIFEDLGFFPATWISLVVMMRMLRVSWWNICIVPSAFLLFVYIFFVKIIGLRLPMDFLPVIFNSV